MIENSEKEEKIYWGIDVDISVKRWTKIYTWKTRFIDQSRKNKISLLDQVNIPRLLTFYYTKFFVFFKKPSYTSLKEGDWVQKAKFTD